MREENSGSLGEKTQLVLTELQAVFLSFFFIKV